MSRVLRIGGSSMTGRIAWWIGVGCLVLAADAARAGTPVYANDFEKGVGKEWSSDKVEATPRDMRHFLGPFASEKMTLKLEKLPPHQYVHVSLDLFIIGTWDGNTAVGQNGQR